MDGIYTFKKLQDFDGNKVEVFADEVMKVENAEASYAEFAVQLVFSTENLGDQRIYCETALEQAPFGTHANYRSKLQVDFKSHLINITKSCFWNVI